MNAETDTTHVGRVAILIVNGGETPRDDRWIRLCLDRIARYTDYPDYHIYLWNNRLGAPTLEVWLLAQPRLTLLSAAAYERLHHLHRTPLQRLYHLAREEGAMYVVTLDSDAHPLCSGWLTILLAALEAGSALAGVWRDEMVPAIRPHVHPSCLCTTVDFIERYQLRLDFDNTHSLERTDTLSHFTWVAEAQGLPIHKVTRSNQRAFHYWMGGIYGNLIYHHAAASRSTVVFHNSAKGQAQSDQHRQLRDAAAEILFNQYDAYMDWLQGRAVESTFEQKMRQLMERAEGTRSLAWWLRRVRSGHLHADVRQRIKKRLQAAAKRHRLIAKVVQRGRKLTRSVNPNRKVDEVPPCKTLAHSFGPQNLYPATAHGWKVRPPDFVGIGAPKSGTTWWFSLLTEHPQVVPHRVHLDNRYNKETYYFLHFQYHNMSAEALNLYRSAFSTPPGTICGEFSVLYLLYPTLLEHLAIAAPETKILVVLRNPIDRFISHWNHLMSNRGKMLFGTLSPQQRYSYNTFSLYTEAMLHSFYGLGLSRLFEYFDREQVLVLQFEQMVQSPETELACTYRFLDIDDRFHPKTYHQPVNQGSYLVPKPDADERARLAAYLKADVQRVVALCPEIDLNLWPDFIGIEGN
ncbi:sulfotransferase [Candidatus Chloroploca sp. M-50]|uniref:Sulfotransferase n=1 Tax=Candidatus Chloroploca mongolica TaxID=2528176 RepID=A0ABS4D496_9CHLR|nr:sulfotransferase [Candidatus Chloroploca mongolica]MBP1464248.1 sulfotransferase [Candidatus Chloroploca mongolica]